MAGVVFAAEAGTAPENSDAIRKREPIRGNGNAGSTRFKLKPLLVKK
jgi:hypothetical protein